MNLRPTIFQLATVCLLALPLVCTASEKPNIVVIMADDLGWRDLHCFGNPQLDTPALDRLADKLDTWLRESDARLPFKVPEK